MELLDFAKTDTAARLRAAAKRGALSHALIFSGSGDRGTPVVLVQGYFTNFASED